MGEIEGRVAGARKGQRIVLFARTNKWYVQPLTTNPFTPIGSDFRWRAKTHFGLEYAALLVDPGYSPPEKANALPPKGGAIAAVAQVKGRGFDQAVHSQTAKQVRFSGLTWTARSRPNDRGGSTSEYDPANVRVDDQGRLHLRITKGPDGWKCAEVRLLDPLGYGTYSFSVGKTGEVEPAAVLGLYTFDLGAPEQNYREMNIELSRWGEAHNKNAQYAIQPFYVPANVVRFTTPPDRLLHSIRWTRGRADFRTEQSSDHRTIAEHSFTSGVPAPGQEVVSISLYPYTRARSPLTRETEVVVEQFEYKP